MSIFRRDAGAANEALGVNHAVYDIASRSSVTMKWVRECGANLTSVLEWSTAHALQEVMPTKLMAVQCARSIQFYALRDLPKRRANPSDHPSERRAHELLLYRHGLLPSPKGRKSPIERRRLEYLLPSKGKSPKRQYPSHKFDEPDRSRVSLRKKTDQMRYKPLQGAWDLWLEERANLALS